MKVIRSLESIEKKYPFPVLTIGAFDGIHLGHQEIIRQMRERAKEMEGTSMLFTFPHHPLKVLDPHRAPTLITPPKIKEEILRSMGLDLLIQVPFSQKFSQMEPRFFAEEVLVRILAVKEIWVGFDFVFGKERQGGPRLLQDLGRELGFSVQIIPPVICQGQIVSSTLIRDLLGQGRVADASILLGRPYVIRGQVVKGYGRGRDLGFPTANIKPPQDFLLPDGVYAGFAKMGMQVYQAAINIGRSPTFSGKDRRIEVHFLGFRGDLYRRPLQIHVLERVREERQFFDEQELIQRIRQDTRQVAQLLSDIESHGTTNGFTMPAFYANRSGELG